MELASVDGVIKQAVQLSDRLDRASERIDAVAELLTAKRIDAVRKLDQTYASLREKLANMEEQTRMQVETFNVHRGLQLNSIGEHIADLRQQTSTLVDQLQTATAVNDAAGSLLAEHRLNQMIQEVNVNELTLDLQWLQDLELVAKDKLATMETLLHSPLHYLKTLALSPGDISMSFASEHAVQGRPVIVEVRQNRRDERVMELLEYRVQDSEQNDLPKREEQKLLADGTITVFISFMPKSSGRHVIVARLYGEHVCGSPLSVVVESDVVRAFLAAEKQFEMNRPEQMADSSIEAEQLMTVVKKEVNNNDYDNSSQEPKQSVAEQRFFSYAIVKREPLSSPSPTPQCMNSPDSVDADKPTECYPLPQTERQPSAMIEPTAVGALISLTDSTPQVKTAQPGIAMRSASPGADNWNAVVPSQQKQQQPSTKMEPPAINSQQQNPIPASSTSLDNSTPPEIKTVQSLATSSDTEDWDAAPPQKQQSPEPSRNVVSQQKSSLPLSTTLSNSTTQIKPVRWTEVINRMRSGGEDWDAFASQMHPQQTSTPAKKQPPTANTQQKLPVRMAINLSESKQQSMTAPSRSTPSGAGDWDATPLPVQQQKLSTNMESLVVNSLEKPLPVVTNLSNWTPSQMNRTQPQPVSVDKVVFGAENWD